jgi:hypothetical protein
MAKARSADANAPFGSKGSIQIDPNHQTIVVAGTSSEVHFENYSNAQIIIDLEAATVTLPAGWKGRQA